MECSLRFPCGNPTLHLLFFFRLRATRTVAILKVIASNISSTSSMSHQSFVLVFFRTHMCMRTLKVHCPQPNICIKLHFNCHTVAVKLPAVYMCDVICQKYRHPNCLRNRHKNRLSKRALRFNKSPCHNDIIR